MKRILAVILVIGMLAGMCGTASGSERSDLMKTIVTYTENVLKYYVDMYDVYPGLIDEDDIIMIYSYIELHRSVQHTYMVELMWQFKSADRGIAESFKLGDSVDIAMEETFNKTYKDWLDGNVTDEQIVEYLIKFARIYVEEDEK